MKSKINRRADADSLPQISDAELVVMRVVWNLGSATANQVVSALSSQAHWKPKTIHTLLNRLFRKGAVTYEKNGREYLFKPAIEAGDFARHASRSFLRRMFDGDIAPFLACFLESKELSRDEIRKLRRLLDGKTS